MQTYETTIRARVDELRAAVAAGSMERGQAVDLLAAAIVPAGPARDEMPQHACPWHTCQATRHTVD